MATTDNVPAPPEDSAFWVYDTWRDKTVMIGTKEDCEKFARKAPNRYKVYPNN